MAFDAVRALHCRTVDGLPAPSCTTGNKPNAKRHTRRAGPGAPPVKALQGLHHLTSLHDTQSTLGLSLLSASLSFLTSCLPNPFVHSYPQHLPLGNDPNTAAAIAILVLLFAPSAHKMKRPLLKPVTVVTRSHIRQSVWRQSIRGIPQRARCAP
jgi:hypothetical protein